LLPQDRAAVVSKCTKMLLGYRKTHETYQRSLSFPKEHSSKSTEVKEMRSKIPIAPMKKLFEALVLIRFVKKSISKSSFRDIRR